MVSVSSTSVVVGQGVCGMDMLVGLNGELKGDVLLLDVGFGGDNTDFLSSSMGVTGILPFTSYVEQDVPLDPHRHSW